MNKHSRFSLEAALAMTERTINYHQKQLAGLESLRQVHLEHIARAEARAADIRETLETDE